MIATQETKGRHNSGGTATRYGMDGAGIKSWLWRDIPAPVRTGLGAQFPGSFHTKDTITRNTTPDTDVGA